MICVVVASVSFTANNMTTSTGSSSNVSQAILFLMSQLRQLFHLQIQTSHVVLQFRLQYPLCLHFLVNIYLLKLLLIFNILFIFNKLHKSSKIASLLFASLFIIIKSLLIIVCKLIVSSI